MAKKKYGKKVKDEEASDEESPGKVATFVTRAVEEYDDEESIFEGFIDALHEKRSSIRETALKGIINKLTRAVMTEDLEPCSEALTEQILVCLKKGNTSEGILACRALSLVSLTMTPNDSEFADNILSDSKQVFSKILTGTSFSEPLRTAVTELFSLLTFLQSSDTDSILEAMDFLWSISQKAQLTLPDLCSSALCGWNLLLTNLDSQEIVNNFANVDFCASLADLVSNRQVSVAKQAGESVALLSEAGWARQLSIDDISSDFDEASNDEASVGTEEGTSGSLPAVDAELADKVRQLAMSGGGRARSKNDRLAQRTGFRKVLSAVQGSFRKVSIKLPHGDSLHVTSWSQFIKLEALKRVLSEGFQVHLQNNPCLHDIFEFEPLKEKPSGFRSVAEKRMYQSPNSVKSKARSQSRGSNRDHVHAENFGYGGDDGY